ncbi:MAG: DNA topoisomerase-3 [Oleiphilaceae bacterium]|jgi:DNA topoisomerase-3
MKLYLAEKPSLGRAIAAALPKPHRKGDGCIWVGDGDVVSWCIGHLLEQAEPEAYDKRFKKWQLDHLPILPDRQPSGWKLLAKTKTRKQFSILKKLIKQASHIIHCGDPDREGQLLVDEVINHVGVTNTVKKSLQRCLINDLNLGAVKQSLIDLKPNTDFASLSISALARSRADWLYGINLTRTYTLQAQKVAFKGVVSIGRVQTPLLGLVVRRDQEIDAFVSKPFYEVLAHIYVPNQAKFSAKWQPSEACSAYQDSEGRVLNKALAENVVSRITKQQALVKAIEHKVKKQAPPLPYSLSILQIEAAKRFGLSAKQVLDVCQSLYETHKLITYPRSDNRYLPKAHFQQSSQIISAISNNTDLKKLCDNADTKIKSKAWNDAKTGAHHGIIPTEGKVRSERLSRVEQQVYRLIAQQYLCQFYPHWVYSDGRIDLTIEGGLFVCKARHTIDDGWRLVFSAEKNTIDTSIETLPKLEVGQSLLCEQGELLEKQTQAPKPYTDATLLAAMTGISRYVSDPEIKKVLKETDGLGTEATRASIIELLFKRQFLQRQGKQIRATESGKGVINSLPLSMTLPDMTAQWESMLNKISHREHNYADFMSPLQQTVTDLIQGAIQQLPTALQGLKQTGFKAKARGKRKSRKPASA